MVKVEIFRWGNCTCTLGLPVSACGPLVDSCGAPQVIIEPQSVYSFTKTIRVAVIGVNCIINSGPKTINPVMNYFTEIATWILKCTFIAYHCVPPLRSPASLGILRWGNASDQKLEVAELRSPASYYTLTTGRLKRNSRPLTVLFYFSFISPCAMGLMLTTNVDFML